ncbi:hypothetical protein GF376_02075 [Candidatus Peregrinibacteria bacterium]|nr:hypothetical protein [Candidatus Peregrinibacteria bacterium]
MFKKILTSLILATILLIPSTLAAYGSGAAGESMENQFNEEESRARTKFEKEKATVTQPSIIPGSAVEGAGGKVFIPINSSGNDQAFSLTNDILPNIATILIGLVGGLALVFVVIGGIQYLTSYGDTEKANNAKKTIAYALIGVIIATLSYAIVAIIAAINTT